MEKVEKHTQPPKPPPPHQTDQEQVDWKFEIQNVLVLLLITLVGIVVSCWLVYINFIKKRRKHRRRKHDPEKGHSRRRKHGRHKHRPRHKAKSKNQSKDKQAKKDTNKGSAKTKEPNKKPLGVKLNTG